MVTPSPGRQTQKLCVFYEKGSCRNGASCRFAHGPSDSRELILEAGRSGAAGGATAAKAAKAAKARPAPATGTKEPCKYFGKGKCARGNSCPFLHSLGGGSSRPSSSSSGDNNNNNNNNNVEDDIVMTDDSHSRSMTRKKKAKKEKKEETDKAKPCAFFARGRCRYGDGCRFSHDIGSSSSSSSSEEEEEEEEEEETEEVKLAAKERALDEMERIQSRRAECGVCLEKVSKKKTGRANEGNFGILVGCRHVYCHDCITEWRDRSKSHECPECRVPSAFVVPNTNLVTDPDRKKFLTLAYRLSLAGTRCPHFEHGVSECPFVSSGSCPYVHLNKDGTPASLKKRTNMHIGSTRARARSPAAGPGSRSRSRSRSRPPRSEGVSPRLQHPRPNSTNSNRGETTAAAAARGTASSRRRQQSSSFSSFPSSSPSFSTSSLSGPSSFGSAPYVIDLT